MTEAKWLKCRDPSLMLDFLGDDASIRKCRLLSCALCRRIWDQLTDYRSQRVIQVVEGVVDGLLSELQIPTAYEDASAPAAIQSIPGRCAISSSIPSDHDA